MEKNNVTYNPQLDGLKLCSGIIINPLDPQTEVYNISAFDQARGLANNCRFANQSPKFYSVAQHCIALYLMVPDVLRKATLFHDTPETIMSDVARPIKKHLPDYQALEAKWTAAFIERYQLDPDHLELIKPYDQKLCEIEQGFLWDTDPDPFTAIFHKNNLPGHAWDSTFSYMSYMRFLGYIGINR